MLSEKLKLNEAGTLGLPIRIVVLTVIGLIGFYAILSAISNAPTPPKVMREGYRDFTSDYFLKVIRS